MLWEKILRVSITRKKIFFYFFIYVSPWSEKQLTPILPGESHGQGPPSLGFSRQEYWSGLPVPSLMHESEKWKWSRSVRSIGHSKSAPGYMGHEGIDKFPVPLYDFWNTYINNSCPDKYNLGKNKHFLVGSIFLCNWT